MKNTIKMSLAAALAVSAFSTSAFAGNLEEMIKGVDVSGYVDYRLENKSIDDSKALTGTPTNDNYNEYAVNVTVNSKVNDIVTATVSAGFDEIQIDNINTTKTNAGVDTSAPVGVDQAYFTFAMGNTTVMAGKQNIPSVFVDQVDSVRTGAGIVAVQRINDAITLAGAHFMNTSIVADTKTTELIAMGNVDMFNYAVNYNMTDNASAATGAESNRYSVDLGAKVAGFTFDLRHSVASAKNVGTTKYDDAKVTKFSAATTLGGVKLGALYAMTNAKKGSTDGLTNTTTDVAIDSDSDAKVHAKVWQLSTQGLNDGDVMVVSADVPVMEKLTAGVTYAVAEGINYANGTKTSDYDADELLFKLTYKMSKNFTIHGRYSIKNEETKNTAGTVTMDKETDYSRVQVKYTF